MGSTPQPPTDYQRMTAEDVANTVIAPTTVVPSREPIIAESWISSVKETWSPYEIGDYDYVFGFDKWGTRPWFIALTVNKDIRLGGNGSGSGGGIGAANTFFNTLTTALDNYAADPGADPAKAFPYSMPSTGSGSDPNTMDAAAKAIQQFRDWLDGTGTGHVGAAPTLAAWTKWLGSEQASWQGTAADAVYQLITEIGNVLTGWRGQLDGPTGAESMPDALTSAGFSLARSGHQLYTEFGSWKSLWSQTYGGYDWWTPENGIRYVLGPLWGLITGGLSNAGNWGKNFPDDRSGYFHFTDEGSETIGSQVIANLRSYLRDGANPAGELQLRAKQHWRDALADLDHRFQVALGDLVTTYSTSSQVLVPLTTPSVHPITVTPAPPPPGGGNDPYKQSLDNLLKNMTTPPPKTPPPTSKFTPPPTTHTPPPTTHTPPPTTYTPPPTTHTPPPTTYTPPPVSLTDFGGNGNATLPKLPPDLWTSSPGTDKLGGVGGLGAFGGLGGFGGFGALGTDLTTGSRSTALDGLGADQRAAKGLVAAEGAAAGAANGEGGIPLYPPTGGMGGMGGMGGDASHDRERHTWIAEDEEVWGTDPDLPPAVFGRI